MPVIILTCSDIRMLPMITICLMINYLDRSVDSTSSYGTSA
jgi:hypothetical protein